MPTLLKPAPAAFLDYVRTGENVPFVLLNRIAVIELSQISNMLPPGVRLIPVE